LKEYLEKLNFVVMFHKTGKDMATRIKDGRHTNTLAPLGA